jgi:hypothetical protein
MNVADGVGINRESCKRHLKQTMTTEEAPFLLAPHKDTLAVGAKAQPRVLISNDVSSRLTESTITLPTGFTQRRSVRTSIGTRGSMVRIGFTQASDGKQISSNPFAHEKLE